MKKLASYAPVDAAVDQKAREFLHDCLPPVLTPGTCSRVNINPLFNSAGSLPVSYFCLFIILILWNFIRDNLKSRTLTT